MGTKNLNSATDLITFSRASGGTALRKISYGSELVTNGDFATNSDWTLSNAVISGGAVSWTTNATVKQLSPTLLTVGKVLEFSFDITSPYTYGYVYCYVAGKAQDLSQRGRQVGSYKFYVVVSEVVDQYIGVASGNSPNHTVDNISIKEVLFDQPDGTLQLWNHSNNTPRIEYNADGTVKGLLIEEARTNLLTYSEDFSNSFWISSRVVRTPNATTSPDGSLTAYKFAPSTTNASHAPFFNLNQSITNGTYSVFAKSAGENYIYLKAVSGSITLANSAVFNLSNGTVSNTPSGYTTTIEDYGNGWYRCSMTTNISGSRYQVGNTADGTDFYYAGNNVDGVYLYGAQLEAGAFHTSYIPTTGSTATRAADVASIATSSRKFNSSSGTFVADFSYTDNGNTNINYVLGGSSSARIMYNNAGSNTWNTFDGTTSTSIGAIDGNGATHKIAVSVREGSSTSTCLDGTLTASASSSALMSNTISSATISIGGGSASQRLNGHIKSIKYYPRRLSNTQLQELTT